MKNKISFTVLAALFAVSFSTHASEGHAKHWGYELVAHL